MVVDLLLVVFQDFWGPGKMAVSGLMKDLGRVEVFEL